jgi:hypothetical protein
MELLRAAVKAQYMVWQFSLQRAQKCDPLAFVGRSKYWFPTEDNIGQQVKAKEAAA